MKLQDISATAMPVAAMPTYASSCAPTGQASLARSLGSRYSATPGTMAHAIAGQEPPPATALSTSQANSQVTSVTSSQAAGTCSSAAMLAPGATSCRLQTK